jgi:hypothetical protein
MSPDKILVLYFIISLGCLFLISLLLYVACKVYSFIKQNDKPLLWHFYFLLASLLMRLSGLVL